MLFYTEYHAAQIEFLIALGVTSQKNISDFSITQNVSIGSYGNVEDYWYDKLQMALNSINDLSKEKDEDGIYNALTLLCNYWGIRSIFEMKCLDYLEKMDQEKHKSTIDEIRDALFSHSVDVQDLDVIDCLLHNWLDEVKVKEAMLVCQRVIKKTFSSQFPK